jgi:hypothetical protein
MSAAEALKAARAVGISIEVDGGDLILQASAAPPRDVIDALSRYKQAIIALMRPASDCWSQEDWRCYFDERVRRAESEGLRRSQAQARAFACCVPEWLNRHMIRSTPGRCVACGRGDPATDLVRPFGTEKCGHAWLHSDCWPEWHRTRQADAIAALAAMDIKK